MTTTMLKGLIDIKSMRTQHNRVTFDPFVAGQALAEGVLYFKDRLQWSGAKIARTLRIPTNTFNEWIRNRYIPISDKRLSPEVEVIVHLLAIHRSLESMFEKPEHQLLWLKTNHCELNGKPEEIIAESTERLIYIRHYLDYIRGRGA